MNELREELIEGKKYTFYKFGVREGFRHLISLSKIVGEPLGLAAEGILKQKKDFSELIKMDVSEAVRDMAIDKIVSSLAAHLDEDKVMSLVDAFLSKVHCQGTPVLEILEADFVGKYGLLLKVLKTAVAVQYGNFFGDTLGLLKLRDLASKQESST